MGVVAVLSAAASSALAGRWGVVRVWSSALVLGVVGLATFAVLVDRGGFATAVLGPAILLGLSLPATSFAATMVGTRTVDPEVSGAASSVLTAGFQVGSAVGLAIVATVAALSLRGGYLAAGAFPALGLLNVWRGRNLDGAHDSDPAPR